MIVGDAEWPDGVAHALEGLKAVLGVKGKLHLAIETTSAQERRRQPQLTVGGIGKGSVVEPGDQKAGKLKVGGEEEEVAINVPRR